MREGHFSRNFFRIFFIIESNDMTQSVISFLVYIYSAINKVICQMIDICDIKVSGYRALATT